MKLTKPFIMKVTDAGILLSKIQLVCFINKNSLRFRTCRVQILWAASIQKVPSSICKMCGFTSSCVYAGSHLGLYSPLILSIVSNDSGSGQRKP